MPDSSPHSVLDNAKSVLAEYERTNTLWLMIRGDGYADDCASLLAGLVEQLEAARGLLVRSLPMTIAAYQKRRGSIVQPLNDDIKAWLDSFPAKERNDG